MVDLQYEMSCKADLKRAVIRALQNRKVTNVRELSNVVIVYVKEIFGSLGTIDAVVFKTIGILIESEEEKIKFKLFMTDKFENTCYGDEMWLEKPAGVETDLEMIGQYFRKLGLETRLLYLAEAEKGIVLELTNF